MQLLQNIQQFRKEMSSNFLKWIWTWIPAPVYDTEYEKDCKTVYDTVNEQVSSAEIVLKIYAYYEQDRISFSLLCHKLN